ncbi:MAG TPA: hypothetical protein VHZ51_17490 [Ktedonobacteraceae bacterium]|nr:hypothetical protein [Ktedonobacteraceae bacterium]
MTIPEVRKLLWQTIGYGFIAGDSLLHWSKWRRRHQARAKRCHYRKRLNARPP